MLLLHRAQYTSTKGVEGLYKDNGKENETYYDVIGYILELLNFVYSK